MYIALIYLLVNSRKTNQIHDCNLSIVSHSKLNLDFYFFFSDVLTNLVGDHNAKRGAIKTFEVLQEYRLNKHLFYVSDNDSNDYKINLF